VSVAKSAKEAGYRIYAADYFGDIDLRRICSGFAAIIKQKRGKSCGKIESKLRPEAFLEMTKSLLERHEIDAILLSSGLDDFFDVLHGLNDLIPILGNSSEVIERVRRKPGFFEELKSLRIAHPETIIVKDVDEAKAAAAEIRYPVVIKPIRGFGGAGIRTAQDSKQIERAFLEASLVSKDLLVQEFINGVHTSMSFLGAEKNVKILTINEQMLGLRFLFQQEPFGYCGNIVPLHFANSILESCKRITEKISSHFGLKGSNGIDLVISKEGTPYVIEVNPRFQGTLECVERVLGMNLVKSHIDACLHDSLPTLKEKTSNFCTRLVLYAPERIVAPDLTVFPEVRDVPLPGAIIEKREPLCSIMTAGKNRELSFQKGKKLAQSIYGMAHPA
ncbi:MAG: ATP-grasp domain-containing protein, partial [Candidatus Bathyarchaeota archaeon]|nr:ATP-grasp domain-containing protein [Candidatus Bathyarchaeota archaeon]